MTEELQLYDVQCKATGDLLLTLEAESCEEAIERVDIAYASTPSLQRPQGNYLLYEHDPEAPCSGPCFRDGFFQLVAARAATKH